MIDEEFPIDEPSIGYQDKFLPECCLDRSWIRRTSYFSFYMENGSPRRIKPEDALPIFTKCSPNLIFLGDTWIYERDLDPAWEIAPGDIRRSSVPEEFEPKRYHIGTPFHIHTNVALNAGVLHVDFIGFERGGPINGFYEYRVFHDHVELGCGGIWFMFSNGGRNFPLASPLGDELLLISGLPARCCYPINAGKLKLFHKKITRVKKK